MSSEAKQTKKRKLSAKADTKKPKKAKTSTPISPEEKKRQADHKKSIVAAHKENKVNKRRGRVSCAKQVHYRAKAQDGKKLDKRWPLREGFINVSVCSVSKKWSPLSPMKLGPIDHKETISDTDSKLLPPAINLENAWQGSKAWPTDLVNESKGFNG
jgi:hypothetical protein